MRVYFRTDSSFEIGSGHVMRCLTLARALREQNAECHFFCRPHPGDLATLIREQGFQVQLLETQAIPKGMPNLKSASNIYAQWLGTSWQIDAAQTINSISNMKPEWLVIDHYAIDRQWETTLRPHCQKIMVIDDLANREHDCELLLDQNLVDNLGSRYDSLVPKHCACLLGPNFALLQPEYRELHPRTPSRTGPVKRILIYFGGADRQNLTKRALGAVLTTYHDGISIDVILNQDSPHRSEILALAQRFRNVKLHENVSSLAKLMLRADLAIGAAGATSWERCCLGLPCVAVTLAENQLGIAKELNAQGFIKWLGDQKEVSDEVLRNAIIESVSNLENLKTCSTRCLSLVDGCGTRRVAAAMLLNASTPLHVRPAELRDEKLLLSLSFDAVPGQYDLNVDRVDQRAHREWFYTKLQSPDDSYLYIIETELGLPIAQVHFARSDKKWDIEYTIAKTVQNPNLEQHIIRASLLQFRSTQDGPCIFKQRLVKSKRHQSPPPTPPLNGEKESVHKETNCVAICTDKTSWINQYIPELILFVLHSGYECIWTHTADALPNGWLCFYLSYSKIVSDSILSRFSKNLVVHESALPKGRGWSPLTWQILEGKGSIPVTLLDADTEVDSGRIYSEYLLEFEGHELVDELRKAQGNATIYLCSEFIDNYHKASSSGRPQEGAPSYYPRRKPEDSRVDPLQKLEEQFNLLRVVDNERYPAYFDHRGHRYYLKIHKA